MENATPEEFGRQAFLTGLSMAFNPYFSGAVESHESWNRGWARAKADLPDVVQRVRDKLPSTETVAEVIGVPLDEWPGNCFGIASILVSRKVVTGKVVYGNYHGPVSKRSVFGTRGYPPHHAWVRTPEGVIVDPTAWAFMLTDRFMKVRGVDDGYYDEAGIRTRMMWSPVSPCPGGEAQEGHPLPDDLAAFLSHLSDGKTGRRLTTAQAFWFANLNPYVLGNKAAEIYRWLESVGKIGLVPIDYQKLVLET